MPPKFSSVIVVILLTGLYMIAQSSPAFAQNRMRNGLPPTSMDSFVYEAADHAEHIYGDEGLKGPPPYMDFTDPHRINTGILDRRDAGLTTGHGSMMPEAWGIPGIIERGPEMSMSGARGVGQANGFYNGLPRVDPNLMNTENRDRLKEIAPVQLPGGYTVYPATRPPN